MHRLIERGGVLNVQLFITRDADGEIVVAVEGLANSTVRSRC